jgi:heme-degrading monooxygenase HmoA
VEFASDKAVAAWRVHPEHVDAQRKGRSKFYSEFRLTVCEVLHEQRFKRDA